MKKGIVIVLVVILIAIVGYFMWSKKPYPLNQQQVSIPTITTSVLTTSLDTSGWQTYQNSFYEFKYPTDWRTSFDTTKTNGGEDSPYATPMLVLKKKDYNNSPDSITISSKYFYPHPQTFSIEGTIISIEEKLGQNFGTPEAFGITNGKAFYYSYDFTNRGFNEGVALASMDKAYTMQWSGPALSAEQKETMLAILSTFKFTQ